MHREGISPHAGFTLPSVVRPLHHERSRTRSEDEAPLRAPSDDSTVRETYIQGPEDRHAAADAVTQVSDYQLSALVAAIPANLAFFILLTKVLGLSELVSLTLLGVFTALALVLITILCQRRGTDRQSRTLQQAGNVETIRRQAMLWILGGILGATVCVAFVLTSIHLALGGAIYEAAVPAFLLPVIAAASSLSVRTGFKKRRSTCARLTGRGSRQR